jgi:hypothetical protein
MALTSTDIFMKGPQAAYLGRPTTTSVYKKIRKLLRSIPERRYKGIKPLLA